MDKTKRKSPLDKVRSHAVSSVFNGSTICPWRNKVWKRVWLKEFIKAKQHLFFRARVGSKKLPDLDGRLMKAGRIHTITKQNRVWTMRATTQIGA